MSIKKYETLLKTIDLGSLTRASEELGYTQSAISQMISGLEDEMGLKLLIRDRAGVRATDLGEQLLPAIRAVCIANEEVQRCVSDLQQISSGTLRIGAVNGTPATRLPQILVEFLTIYPDLQVELWQGSATEGERLIASGALDCCLSPSANSEHIERLWVMDEPFLAVFPPNRKDLPPHYDLALLNKECYLRPWEGLPLFLQEYLPKSTPFSMKGQDELGILSLISAGFGMSILPEHLVNAFPFPVVSRPCIPPVKCPLFFLYRDRKNPSSVLRRFLRFAQQYCAE